MAFDLDQVNIGIVSDFTGRAAAIVGSLAGPVGSAISEIVVNNGTNQALTFLKEKQNQKKSSIVNICNQKISKGSCCEKFKPLIIATVEICFDNYKSFNEKISREFDANKLAKELVDKYISGDHELESLAGILTEILSKVIQQYLEDLVKDPKELVSIISSLQQIDTGQDKSLEEIRVTMMNRIESVEHSSKQQDLSPLNAKNRYEKYRSAWNEPMFLHRGPRRPNLLLSDVYQVPRYDEDFTDPHDSSNSFHSHANTDLDQKLRDALNAHEENKMLFVLGQPGSGKSTLITYLLNKHTVRDTRKIRVFRFRELGIENWNIDPIKLPELILSHLSLMTDDLSDSILIMDGLDEVPMAANHKSFIDELNKCWCNFDCVKNFSLFITCRISRIPRDDIEHMCYTTLKLCPLSKNQINDFCDAYYSITGEERTVLNINNDNKDALGIPIILYMVLATHIDVGKSTSIVDVYDKLFSITDEEHSLYHRPYDSDNPKDLTATPEQIHLFCKNISNAMWDEHPQEAYADSKVAQAIWKQIAKGPDEKTNAKSAGEATEKKEKVTHLHDVLSEQYFIEDGERHEIRFVHRSIYEYFVAVSIFEEIKNLYNSTPADLFSRAESNSAIKHLAAFARRVCVQYLDDYPEIREFLFHMLQNRNSPLTDNWWDNFLIEFLSHGFIGTSIYTFQNGIKCISQEHTCFINVLLLTQELRNKRSCYPLFSKTPSENSIDSSTIINDLSFYLRIPDTMTSNSSLNLQNMYLFNIDLSMLRLSDSNFESSKMQGANLQGSNLYHANMQDTELQGANLTGANLRIANLEGAKLQGANLQNADLSGTNMEGVNLQGVLLKNANLQYSARLKHALFNGLLKSELDQAILPKDFQLPYYYEIGNDGIIHLKC